MQLLALLLWKLGNMFSNQIFPFGIFTPVISSSQCVDFLSCILMFDHGYSLTRRLNSTYSGSIFKVRRGSDSAELDIGFADNEVDLVALQSFISGTSGNISVLYDQFGNVDLVQTVFGRQPQVSAGGGVLNFLNGKLTITTPNASIRTLQPSSVLTFPKGHHYLGIVNRRVGIVGFPRLVGFSDASDFLFNITNNVAYPGSSFTYSYSPLVQNFANYHYAGADSPYVLKGYENNILTANVSSQTRADGINLTRVLGNTLGTGSNLVFDGDFQELIISKQDITDQEVSDIQDNVIDFYSIP